MSKSRPEHDYLRHVPGSGCAGHRHSSLRGVFMRNHNYRVLALLAAVVALTLSGCAQNHAAEAAAAAAPPPQVTVAQVVSRAVNEFDEFTGRFEAVERVEVRPRVSGYISSVNFTDGNEVKKGEVLFVIDPRP